MRVLDERLMEGGRVVARLIFGRDEQHDRLAAVCAQIVDERVEHVASEVEAQIGRAMVQCERVVCVTASYVEEAHAHAQLCAQVQVLVLGKYVAIESTRVVRS